MKKEGKNPPPCLHCVLVAAINAHHEAHPTACHCECCLTMALAEVIRDVLADVAEQYCAVANTAKH